MHAYLGAEFVDGESLAVVDPGVVEHEPVVVNELPRICVEPSVKLLLDGRQVHRGLDHIKVILRQTDVTQFYTPDSNPDNKTEITYHTQYQKVMYSIKTDS